MDSSKENMVSLYGDRFLERGFAVLALDGPGQAEAITRGVIRPQINQRFPLLDAAQAHVALESRQTSGASVLLP